MASDSERPSYHHGNLRAALLVAAEDLLRERGANGFSLRETARRAGVSPSAPAHHFGDTRGLLTVLATGGFRRLTKALGEASLTAAPQDRLAALAQTYLAFALANGALFTIMWSSELLDQADADYLAAGREAFAILERVATGNNEPVRDTGDSPDPAVIACWAMMHGMARLKLDGALAPLTDEDEKQIWTMLPLRA